MKSLLGILAVIVAIIGTILVLFDQVIVSVFFELISMCILALIYPITRKIKNGDISDVNKIKKEHKILLTILALFIIFTGTLIVLSGGVIVGVFFLLISMCLICMLFLILRKGEENTS